MKTVKRLRYIIWDLWYIRHNLWLVLLLDKGRKPAFLCSSVVVIGSCVWNKIRKPPFCNLCSLSRSPLFPVYKIRLFSHFRSSPIATRPFGLFFMSSVTTATRFHLPFYGGPVVQIHPLHDPQFLHSTVSFVHSTAKFLYSTIPCVTIISVPCPHRKSQLPSDSHSSDTLRVLACVMYVFRWEMLAALIGMGIIDLQTPTDTKPPESPSNDTKS